MPAYRRSVVARASPGPKGIVHSTATVDDWFHGFEVTLELRDDQLVRAAASTFRHPWNTCPGALDSVTRLSGPASKLGDEIISAPRDSTCVHVNDLVWLAAHQHAHRQYEIEVTPSLATMHRDDQPLLSWKLRHWTILGTGKLAGLAMSDKRWADRLDEINAGVDLREAVKILRRGVLVAMGYYELDWDSIERGTDIPHEIMANTCHTFSAPRVSTAVCLADVPDRRSRPRD